MGHVFTAEPHLVSSGASMRRLFSGRRFAASITAAASLALAFAGCKEALTDPLVVPEKAVKLAIVAQPPASVVSGGSLTPSIQVAVQSASGATLNEAATITLALSGGTSGAVLGGTV